MRPATGSNGSVSPRHRSGAQAELHELTAEEFAAARDQRAALALGLLEGL